MVHFEILGQVGIISLERTQALNALTKDMILAMYSTLMDWKNLSQVEIVVIRSKSQDIFCAGGDIRSVYEMRDFPLDVKVGFFEMEYQLDYLLSNYPKPVISLMNGLTMGGGVGLAMHVAYPVAGEHMIFAMPETAIGFFPDVGGCALLNQLPRAWQNYLGVFGQRLTTRELVHFGLVHCVITCHLWPELLNRLISTIWTSQVSEQVEKILKEFAALSDRDGDGVLEPLPYFERFATESFSQLMHTIDSALEPKWLEFKSKIEKLSPLSMQVAFLQLQHAQQFRVKDALIYDFYLLQHFLELPEFYEGIRAMIIDKDKTPHWRFADWKQITPSAIDKLFDFKNLKTLQLD
jgi:enoyl-CoA hydratase